MRGGDSITKHAHVARNAQVTPSSAIPRLDYERLRESLAAAGAVVVLTELHGGVCGALCAGGPVAARRWLTDSLDDEQLAASPAAVADDLDELDQYERGDARGAASSSSSRYCRATTHRSRSRSKRSRPGAKAF